MESRNLPGAFLVCIALAFVPNLPGCGDNDGNVEIDLSEVCNQALAQVNNPACKDSSFAMIEDLKDCITRCDLDDQTCFLQCFDEYLGATTPACSPGTQLLFSGACGACYGDCANSLAFTCLPGSQSGIQCLDDLYECLNGC